MRAKGRSFWNLARTWLEDHIAKDALAIGEACCLHGRVRAMALLHSGCAVSGKVEDNECGRNVP